MSLRLAVAACFAALAAAAASYMLNVVPLPNVPTLNLSTHGYDIVIMDAPVATGTLLHVLAWVLTQPAIGPLLTRFLLNNNKVWHIRELAAQVPQTVVFKPLPGFQFLGAAWEEAKLLHLTCALEGAVEDGRLGNQQERPPHFFHELDGLLEGGA